MPDVSSVYSPSENAIYPSVLYLDYIKAGTWPSDGIDISEEDAVKFSGANKPAGKILAMVDGSLCWIDEPPPPNNVLLARAISEISAVYKSDINELNTAYLAAIVNDGPSEATKQLAVRGQITARKAKYASDIQDAKLRYPA
ncbi:TPA: tail assembly chaperone [Enterobacter asburiae]|nr:tail assembly chaperone [Enterobacter asburiae]